jgi:tetratricopeptide (TPR) repeat protein
MNAQNFLPLPAPQNAPASLPSDPTMANLDDLLRHGNFHSAALIAVQLLISMPVATSDYETIFHLWYVRLSSLVILGHAKIAATESKSLGDLTSSFYRNDPASGSDRTARDESPGSETGSMFTGGHIVPWQLRVMAVRLQALGFGEWRRGIMAYYALAEEARYEASNVTDASEKRMWADRLAELGVLVASACVEMGDGEAAGRHLASLNEQTANSEGSKRDLAVMEALVWLRLGDILRAKTVLEQKLKFITAVESDGEDLESNDHLSTQILKALVVTCDGDVQAAVEAWSKLHEAFPRDGVIAQNLAVCLLYTGRIQQSKAAFEELMTDENGRPAFQPLIFNIATVYELTADGAQALKIKLAERVNAAPQKGLNHERAPREFKLEGVVV